MSKKAYKELQKKLKNKFTRVGSEYGIPSVVGLWFLQCGIIHTSDKLNIVCTIFGSVPYPHQEADRKIVLKYLKKNKYKQFKKTYFKTPSTIVKD